MMDWIERTQTALWQRACRETLPHAVLLTGKAGVGKGVLARRFANALLCEQPDEAGIACGECHGCVLVKAGSHPDLRICQRQDDSREIKVDQIRELIGQVALTSTESDRNVFIIDPADAMNHSAANAFLKTLEEPSDGTLILMVASRPHRLPATVRSRCQAFVVNAPDRATALSWLGRQNTDEDGGRASAEACESALDAADGAPLTALEMLREKRVAWWSDTQRVLDDVAADRLDIPAVAAAWKNDPDLSARLDWWVRWGQQAVWKQMGVQPKSVGGLTVSADLASLARYVERLIQTRRLLDSTLSRDLLVEELLIGWRDLMQKGA